MIFYICATLHDSFLSCIFFLKTKIYIHHTHPEISVRYDIWTTSKLHGNVASPKLALPIFLPGSLAWKKNPNQLFSSVWRNQSCYLLYVFLNIVFIRNYIVNIYYLKFYASQRLSNVEKQRDTYLSFLHLSSLALLLEY